MIFFTLYFISAISRLGNHIAFRFTPNDTIFYVPFPVRYILSRFDFRSKVSPMRLSERREALYFSCFDFYRLCVYNRFIGSRSAMYLTFSIPRVLQCFIAPRSLRWRVADAVRPARRRRGDVRPRGSSYMRQSLQIDARGD